MKILVFDDSSINRASAQAQFKDHDLTVVGTYDEAQKLLAPRYDYKKAESIVKNQFGDFNPYLSNVDESTKKAYFAAKKKADEEATTYADFEVVLTDLLVPASEQEQGRDGLKYVGQEMPIGIFIGLLAAVRGRAKYVAVFTDSSHHSHPASACFDVFNNEGEGCPIPFMVGSCRVLLSNTRDWVCHFDPNDLTKRLGYEIYSKRSDTVRAKNWTELLEYLIK